ncbi:MAG: hypothetical protein A2621_02595 [Alphaproteobacteria bacterium RIFCSPHIGHO2_01_FULL_41_14]|nr:MAG: hypothetical protein A2065_04115 [Alphaproteobacteria bacterium GWB1_45_5]OFW76687.1 MAG: hypothetical protein A3K20_00705 [Alphaproteobacteria bacterium GWA1_45_9]OFW89766.1 MAG: hypothetical protein A2621_02595 [Alphaproteobacteria bacterium RIFCSPHIGHO2_01_FULL_41_14]HCI48438.1 membrane protein insertion efficiency factor YidD [Holosporales bacterium]
MTKTARKILFSLQKVILFVLLLLIDIYRYLLKFILVNEGCCYAPSCSLYMKDALRTHGVFRGTFLGTKRILRCHPWKNAATPLYDPVPPHCIRKDLPWTQKKEI